MRNWGQTPISHFVQKNKKISQKCIQKILINDIILWNNLTRKAEQNETNGERNEENGKYSFIR